MPGPNDGGVWQEACRAAIDLWSRTVEHPLVSAGFKETARSNQALLESVSGLGRLLPR
jgi:hypothetical protein